MPAAPRPALGKLRTPRLHLQRVTRRDLREFERMQADAETMATLGGVRGAGTDAFAAVGFAFERGVEHAGLPHLLYRLRASDWRGVAKG